jgi:hypothetical protein
MTFSITTFSMIKFSIRYLFSTLIITTFSIMKFGIWDFMFLTLSVKDTQQNAI